MKALREMRERAGITMSDLARATEVSRQAVWEWETFDTWPTAPMIPKIAKALGCTADELFAREFERAAKEG